MGLALANTDWPRADAGNGDGMNRTNAAAAVAADAQAVSGHN
jgi:hypothetical protein